MHLVEHTPKIWTIEGFLNSQRCTEMIEWSEQKGYQPASVTTVDGPRMMSRTRNNDRLIFDYMPLADEAA